jgi:hypothetical protein
LFMYRLDLTPVNGLGRITWGWAARRGACGTAWASVDIGQVCRGHASRRRGPGQPVTVLHSPNAPLWRTVCARGGAKGKAEGPGGLNSAGGGPRAGPGRRAAGRPGRRPHPPIAPLSIYLQIYNMRHDTCALLVAGPCTTVRRPDRDATREDRRTRPISEHARETRRAGPHALTYRRDHTHTARDMRITHGSRMPCTYSPG